MSVLNIHAQTLKNLISSLAGAHQATSRQTYRCTDEVIHQVQVAANVLRYQVAQLVQLGEESGEAQAAADAIRKQLASERPWRDLASIEPHIETVREFYVAEGRRILGNHGDLAASIRARVKGREGFSTLTADQSHHVLRPIAEALPNTSEEAISPGLLELRDGAHHALLEAEEEANERLDQILSEGKEPPVRKVELRLRNREIASQAEFEAVFQEVRGRVEPELRAGRRVRLVE